MTKLRNRRIGKQVDKSTNSPKLQKLGNKYGIRVKIEIKAKNVIKHKIYH